MERHNIVYRITNQINGKYYIGVHTTKDLNDGYMGSGIAIKNAIDKYGVECFTKEILYDFDTIEEAYGMEKRLVTIDIVRDRNSYNLHTGGKGGWGDDNITFSSVFTSNGWIKKEEFDPTLNEGAAKNMVVVKDLEGKRTRVYKDDPRYLSGELVPWNKGIQQPSIVNEKRSKALKGVKHPKYICESCGRKVSEHWRARHNNKCS